MKLQVIIVFNLMCLSTAYSGVDCIDCVEKNLIKVSPVDKIIRSFDMTVKAAIDEKTAVELVNNASFFLNKVKDTTDFSEGEADAHIKNLKEIMKRIDFPIRLRARTQLICSGLIGRMAAKKKSGELGKESFHLAKAVMKVDPTYREGKVAYCGTIASFTDSNIIARKFIEAAVGISIAEEAREALSLIAREKWQEDVEVKPYYLKIKKFLD